MENDRAKGKAKGKAKSEVLPNPHSDGPARNAQSVAGDTVRGRGVRPISVGTLNDFGVGGAFLDADSRRPDSLGRVRSSAEFEQLQSPQPPLQRRRASTHVLIETLPVQPPLHSVPFPSVSVSGRSASPGPEEVLRPGSRASRLDLQTAHARTQSNASLGSKALLNDVISDQNANLFVARPPSPDRADPKANRARSMSNASMGTMASKNVLTEENPFSVRPPSPSRSSRFDPKVHVRTTSVNSMGTRALLDNDVDVESRRDRPLSTLELLRPKVLVMPSPLQSAAPPPLPPPVIRPHSGFQTSTDGPPLPPGARSARPSTQSGPALVPIASNSFTPNPRASLSLSQLAFRNTLVVGGERDIAYSDIDRHLPRAVKDGEQAQFEEEEEVRQESPVPTSVPLPPVPPPTEIEIRRAAGKLYGRSLIDNLEHRKLEMKQKARTFHGDNRPSMMVRGQIRRSSTLIDPETLGALPPSQNLEKKAPTLSRRNSGSAGPLLDLNGEKPPALGASASTGDFSKGRSVFGVDTLWDREMAKLKEIETQEKAEADERKRREREEMERRERKNKKKGKSKGKGNDSTPGLEVSPSHGVSESRVSSRPPTLPAIQKPILKRAPIADDEGTESESDDDVPLGQAIGRTIDKAADSWVAESSDEDEGPRRTTGVGPRYSSTKSPAPHIPPLSNGEDGDSDEDLPLTAAAERIAKRATQLPRPNFVDDDEDEDKPLAAVLSESKLSLGRSQLSLPDFSFDNISGGQSTNDDDEQPLGLRASRLPPMASQGSLAFTSRDDDDRPLAFHPEQQRRTQNQMLAQVQQQQQIMMQAQLQNGFYFGAPAMMGSGFFGPPMGVPPVMMGMPVPPPSPPPVHDAAKFGRVDRWRHDVAVEGER
ncbi:hypothetical protein BS17DRAFT_709690 [Gyrodon lividus]|nr:hypothetical protein BS17DRAFT_709690 [Gyrodon lividus]